ncbi:hypothetical protein C8J57DRAFT_1644983 [Mycena rebaudengoi]|nr:hypothetical protein C8J57DRAFT_1644983 [Mycena rebaudengoi]
MPTTANFKNIIEYTILAATTAQNIAETGHVPFLRSTAVLSLSITKSVETIRLNKEEYAKIMERIFTVLNAQQKGTLGKIKGLSGSLKLWKDWKHASKISARWLDSSRLSHRFNLLIALLKSDSDLTGSDHSSVTGTLSSSGNNSSGSLGLLPPCPKIFHGREGELHDVVKILGAWEKPASPQQCFIFHKWKPTTIADHIGMEKGSKMANKIAHYFAHAPPSLLVLDNLETTWGSLSSRSEVEEFLSLLTDVPQLGLMITLRGAERPSKVKWTRPFLAPLQPLSNVATWQTFIEVAEEGHDDASIKELLDLTGNLPLTVSLISSVAGSEGCAQALSRWKLESTQMLSEGYDQRSSLDISIMLSYTSSRMTPGAQELLSILSMLPDGLADSDMVQAKLPIPDILACKATLIQTALAFVGRDQHLKVLVPIREHIFLSGHMRDWEHNPIFGEYLVQLLECSYVLPDLDFNSHITLGTRHFKSKDPLEQARWYRALGIYLQLAKSDFVGALKYFQRAYSLAESVGYPTIVGIHVLQSICSILIITGTPSNALTHAKVAHKYAEHLGDIYLQAWSLYLQGKCHTQLANYGHAQCLLQKARHIVAIYQQQNTLERGILNVQAEIHLVKSEYLESRNLQVAIASRSQPTSYQAILANLNIAFIDITIGAESKNIRQNLHMAQSHLKALYGYNFRETSVYIDYVAAELNL